MPRRHDRHYRIPALDRLAPDFARLEAAQRRAEPPGRRPRRLAWLGAGGAAIAALLAGIVIAVLSVGSAGASDVRRSAAAAEHAGTFRFSSRSELTRPDGRRQATYQSGAVDLGAPGYLLRASSPGGAGFERLVFPDSLYVRPTGVRLRGRWRQIALAPHVEIAPRLGGSGYLSDPLGLLAVLRDTRGARALGRATVNGAAAERFGLETTLGAFLSAEGVHTPASLARDHVHVSVWLDSASRVLRAERVFELGGHGTRLLVATSFAGYGQPVGLRPPRDAERTGVVERLNPVAGDPVSAAVLGALLNHSRHPATPNVSPAQRP